MRVTIVDAAGKPAPIARVTASGAKLPFEIEGDYVRPGVFDVSRLPAGSRFTVEYLYRDRRHQEECDADQREVRFVVGKLD